MTRPMSSGVYAFPKIECTAASIITNTTPTVAYRGAGRPEATAAVERAMDLFALELGLDPVDVRRKNLIAKFDEPYTTVVGQTYDVGDFEGALDRVLAAAGYDQLRAEQKRRREAGDPVQLGIGVSCYVEITGGVPPFGEEAKIEVKPDGRAVVYTGTSPHGQGHVTAWSMIAAEETGIPMDMIDVVWGDTAHVPKGGGTMGSRSLQQGGAAVQNCAIELVAQAKDLAAKLLEADAADVVLDTDKGAFHVAGTPAVSKTWADVAASNGADGIAQQVSFTVSGPTFPFGAHVAVVEVDTETGRVKLIRHVACDDAGRVINPLLLEGQIHGGIAQGAAQALLEEVRYDEDGNPITGNLADYAFISAAELPELRGGGHGDADADQPARRQGHRRVGHDRLHAGRAVGRGRRRVAPRRAPHRHAGHRRARVAGHPSRQGLIPAFDREEGAIPLQISVTVNGTTHTDDVEPRTLLVHYIRDTVGLTGTNIGCDTSSCGACTLHIERRVREELHGARRAGRRRRHPHHRGPGHRRPAPPDAGGVPPEPRPAVRLLHAGHGHGGGRPAATRTPIPPRPRCGKASRATCAAAPATTTS